MTDKIAPIHYCADRPAAVTRENVYGMFAHYVNYDITELAADDRERTGYGWSYRQVRLDPGVWTYDAVVSAIVRAEYPDDRMAAVLNNYLSAPDEGDHRGEFATMQEHRAMAKAVARTMLDCEYRYL